MNNSLFIYSLGFAAQGLFGLRMIIQWVHSERAGKVMSPSIFWQTSLLASFLFMIYGILRFDAVIIGGQFLSYFIYIRNLQLKDVWKAFPAAVRWLAFLLPIVTIVWFVIFSQRFLGQLQINNDFTEPIIFLGAVGQLSLNLRFLYQWWYSEKHKASILPTGFWMISTLGSVIVVVYALYRQDPVLLVAQSMGLVVYTRNLYLAFRRQPA